MSPSLIRRMRVCTSGSDGVRRISRQLADNENTGQVQFSSTTHCRERSRLSDLMGPTMGAEVFLSSVSTSSQGASRWLGKFGLISGGDFTDIAPVVGITLNDARVREALLCKLAKQKARPRAVLEELHVHRGRAIAD